MGGGGSPMRGRAAGGRLKKGRTERGFSRRAGGKAFPVGTAQPSTESTESREWARGGTPVNSSGKEPSAAAGGPGLGDLLLLPFPVRSDPGRA